MLRPLLLATLVLGCASAPTVRPTALGDGDNKLTVDGHVIAYHVRGAGPVAIVHPGGPGIDWTYVRMPALERSMTVVYIEPVGTGGSERPAKLTDYTWDRYVADVERLRAGLGLERFWLIGHSHGGFVAQLYAIAHPERLAGLVLYDTADRLDADFQAAVGANAERLFGRRSWYREAMAALAAEDGAKTDDEMTAIISRELPLYFDDYDALPDGARRAMAGLRAWVAPSLGAVEVGSQQPFDTRAGLAKLLVPTLVIVGRSDFITSVPFAEEMHALIHGSRLAVIEHAGHMVHVEQPQAFTAAVMAFVESVGTGRD